MANATFLGNPDGRLFYTSWSVKMPNNMEDYGIFYYLRNLEGGMRGCLNDIINIPLGGVHLCVNYG